MLLACTATLNLRILWHTSYTRHALFHQRAPPSHTIDFGDRQVARIGEKIPAIQLASDSQACCSLHASGQIWDLGRAWMFCTENKKAK